MEKYEKEWEYLKEKEEAYESIKQDIKELCNEKEEVLSGIKWACKPKADFAVLDYNLKIVTIMWSFITVSSAIRENDNLLIILAIAAVAIGVVGIWMHSQKVKYRQILEVINDVEKEMKKKKKLKRIQNA